MKELGQVPMAIAVTGHDTQAVTLLASELAMFLKYPLIAGDDVSLAFSSLEDDISLAFSSFGIKFPEDVNEFVAFFAACRVAFRQLTRVRISVIIKAVVTIALPFHVIRELIEEVVSGGARLIVACDVQREGETLRLSIQAGKKTTELKLTSRDQKVDVKDFVRFIEESARDQTVDVEDYVRFLEDSTAPTFPVERIEDAPKFRHLHKLILSTGPILLCKRCSKPVYGTHYQCLLCQAVPLHNECATSPPISAVDGTCPYYLLENPPIYDFPHALRKKSNICDEFQDDCYDCLLETVLKNYFLPMILCHRLHKEHLLIFTIMPHSFNYGFQCRACGKLGKLVSYKCCYDDCNFDLHLKCSLLPQNDMHYDGLRKTCQLFKRLLTQQDVLPSHNLLSRFRSSTF